MGGAQWASQGSQAQYARSSSPHRRRTNSLIAATRRAAARASARASSSIAVTTAASLAERSPLSNMCSSIPKLVTKIPVIYQDIGDSSASGHW